MPRAFRETSCSFLRGRAWRACAAAAALFSICLAGGAAGRPKTLDPETVREVWAASRPASPEEGADRPKKKLTWFRGPLGSSVKRFDLAGDRLSCVYSRFPSGGKKTVKRLLIERRKKTPPVE